MLYALILIQCFRSAAGPFHDCQPGVLAAIYATKAECEKERKQFATKLRKANADKTLVQYTRCEEHARAIGSD